MCYGPEGRGAQDIAHRAHRKRTRWESGAIGADCAHGRLVFIDIDIQSVYFKHSRHLTGGPHCDDRSHQYGNFTLPYIDDCGHRSLDGLFKAGGASCEYACFRTGLIQI